jgi:hypothetical protein
MRPNNYISADHIFIDSSIFEEQNFLNSSKIQSLFRYAREGAIKIHVTTVSKLELYNRIEKRISESRTEFRKLVKGFNYKHIRVVKNIGFYDSIKLPDIDIKKHSDELKRKFDSLFERSHVHTIRTENIPITLLVKDYYSKNPPFHNSGKQNEFIDAFILKSLEKWCERHKTKIYVLSKDPDFLGYKSDYLIMEDNLANFLEQISLYYNKRYKLNRVTKIRKILHSQKRGLELESTNLIEEKLSIRSEKFSISPFEVVDNKLDSYQIISMSKNVSEVECNFKCTAQFYVYEDSEHYDYYPRQEKFTIIVPVIIEIYPDKGGNIKWMLEKAEYIYKQ